MNFLHRYIGYGVACALMSCALLSCIPDSECRQDMSVTAGVDVVFYMADTTGLEIEQLYWDSISVQGVGSDSILYDNAKRQEVLRLPLRMDTSVTAYALTWHEQPETLYIHHDNELRFVSQACGCTVFHTIDSAWTSGGFITKPVIVNAAVANVPENHITLLINLR